MSASLSLAALLPGMRWPRLRLLANGIAVGGAMAAEVNASNSFQASSFTALVSLSADPVQGAAWWESQTAIRLEIQAALGASLLDPIGEGWTRLLLGDVDTLQIDPIANTVQLAGRDLTHLFIDARTQRSFVNLTASQIATQLADEQGLTAQVTATTTPVGQYYQLEHDTLVLGGLHRITTEWDLLVWLARHEGFDCYVDGQTLVFAPPTSEQAVPFVVSFGPGAALNVIDVRMERALTLAADVQVTVKSWDSRSKAAFVRTVRATSASGSTNVGKNQQSYVFVVPGLTPAEALAYAQQRLAEITRHERIVTITMPGETTLTPRSRIALAGSGTGFDQLYYPDHILRRIDAKRGFVQTVTAKNHSTTSQVTVL